MPLFVPASNRSLSFGPAPEDHGQAFWSGDPATAQGTAVISAAGALNGCRIFISRPALITNLYAHVGVAGAVLTADQCKAAIYNSAGALQGTTTNQATAWTTIGGKVMPLVSSFTAVPGYYDIVVWFNGTTSPQFARGTTNTAGNSNLTGAAIRFFIVSGPVTTTAPGTLGTKAAQTNSWLFGAS